MNPAVGGKLALIWAFHSTSTVSAYTLGRLGILTKFKQGPIIPELPPLIKQPLNTVEL